MKTLKLKHTALCIIVLYIPVIILASCGFCALMLMQNSIGGIIFFSCLGVCLFYLIKLFRFLLSSEILFHTIRYWRKDRLWFEPKGRFDEKNILDRIKKYGKLWKDDVPCVKKPLCIKLKKCISHTEAWSSFEKSVVVFREKEADEICYSEIMGTAQNIAFHIENHMNEKKISSEKAPVCRSMAVVIIADKVSEDVITLVRNVDSKESSVILPCIIDLNVNKCYFDGMKTIQLVGPTPKNVAVNLIKKLVFNGKLHLKNNTNYDYSRIDKGVIEKPFIEYVKEVYRDKQKHF